MSYTFYLNQDPAAFSDLPSYEQLSVIYDDIELAIIFDWAQLERTDPLRDVVADAEQALENDIDECREDEPIVDSTGQIRLLCSAVSNVGYAAAISNGVARLVLSAIQHRLPQWSSYSEEQGHVRYNRRFTARRDAAVEFLPKYLFTINWADSGPGFSWPESYYATYLPGFNCYVVTASQDGSDTHGVADEAIGAFPADTTLEQGAHDVIVGWWGHQAATWDQYRWAYLFGVGEILNETADDWADEIWDADTGEQREDALLS